MGMSLGMPDAHDPPYGPEMLAQRAKVLAACKANNLAFLEQVTPENVTQQIDAGVMVGAVSKPKPRPRLAAPTAIGRSPGKCHPERNAHQDDSLFPSVPAQLAQ